MTAMAKPSSDILRGLFEGPGMVKVYEESSQEILLQVASGYRFKPLGSEGVSSVSSCTAGRSGMSAMTSLFEIRTIRKRTSYPVGSRRLRASETRTYPIYVVEPIFMDGISVSEEPNQQSRELFVLAPLQAVPILETLPKYYKVLLPGPTKGFVLRNQGGRRDWAPVLSTHFGFYGVEKNQHKVVPVYYAPMVEAECMAQLDAYSRLPVVEEWDGWFKVQLDDGCQGFVPEASGNRTIFADTFIERSKDGSSGLARAGLIATGLLTAAIAGAALREDG